MQKLETEVYSTTAADGSARTDEQRTREAIQELAVNAGRYDAAASVSPENAREIEKHILSKELDMRKMTPQMREKLVIREPILDANNKPTGQYKESMPANGKITVRQAIEAMRGDESFLNMRRELGNVSARYAQQAMQQSQAGVNQVFGQQQGPIPPP